MKTDDTNQHQRSVSDSPSISERQWETLSVTSAILTTIIFSIVALWLFEGGLERDDLWRVQLFTPFGVALFAGVTYCTVNWRGKITTRQADLAASQLRLSEREGKAKLLQEGAKLLGEVGKPSHVSAGISTLVILIAGDDDDFAIQAMNLIADFVQREMSNSHKHAHQKEAFLALKRGDDAGRQPDREIRFDADNTETRWQMLYGATRVIYVGGFFLGLDGEIDLKDRSKTFSDVTFEICDNIVFNSEFDTCTFSECYISGVRNFWSSREPEMYNSFKDCNFSEALFDNPETLRWIRGHNNYFVDGVQPRMASGDLVDWLKYFSVEKYTRVPILF
ncbi:MAG: hypothetical protein JWL86_2508 [Rhizobium sp.]|nr:hypothetical protein [Rhizobium sp.]